MPKAGSFPLSKETLIFLSGRIDGLSDSKRAGWRKQADQFLHQLGYKTYNPTALMTGEYSATPNEVFMNDTYYLKRADVVLCNMDLPETTKSHEGPFFTIGEMFLAHNLGIPIITFGSCFKGRPGYEAIITKNLESLSDTLDYIALNYR